jgi:hypothetical protein
MSVASKLPRRGTSIEVAPSAARLTNSLRDIGYDFQSAVADVIDNSLAAGASRVSVDITFDGASSSVMIADDGHGMSTNGIIEALRFGSRRDYDRGQLGRYGLGLKTASLSQGRAVSVMSRRPVGGQTSIRSLDLDVIEEWDDWLIIDPSTSPSVERAARVLDEGFNTVVLWEKLDRLLPFERQDGGWARRRIEAAIDKCSKHLSMVFHRFLERGDGVTIEVNGTKLTPWDPFARSEERTQVLAPLTLEIDNSHAQGIVNIDRYVLPARTSFSSQRAFEELSGPLKWNRQQGLYIYRADRLVQWGGWAGIRGIDEHTKLARVALRFNTELDDAFNTNVAKMRVSLPGEIKQRLAPAISEVCLAASEVYRRAARLSDTSTPQDDLSTPPPGIVNFALSAAAMQTGDSDALARISEQLRVNNPEIAALLGL